MDLRLKVWPKYFFTQEKSYWTFKKINTMNFMKLFFKGFLNSLMLNSSSAELLQNDYFF